MYYVIIHCLFFYWGVSLFLIGLWVKVKVAQSCLTLCNPTDCTVHGIVQARILEWIAFPFSRGSHQPRGQTQISCIAGGFFSNWTIREAYWFVSALHILCETLISIGKSFPSLYFCIFFQIKVFTFTDSLIAYMFSKAYPYYVTIF